MMGLVDYGSDSDSDNDVSESVQPQKNANVPSASKDSDGFEEDLMFEENEEVQTSSDRKLDGNDALDDLVKPKAWERELAEKARKKLEKKAKKAAKKEKKRLKNENGVIPKTSTGIVKPLAKKEKGKVVISAFGALGSIVAAADSDSDDDQDAKIPAKSTAERSNGGFLSALPAPKGKNNISGIIFGSVPKSGSSSIQKLVPKQASSKKLVANSELSDDDDDDSGDFFGLSSKADTKSGVSYEVPSLPQDSSMDVVGPARPSVESVHPSNLYNLADAEEDYGSNSGVITDEQAHRLIMQHAHDIGPGEGRSYNEMTSSIVNVRVDDAMGPDIKANLLKNLTHRAFAQSASAPLPSVPGVSNQVARRKHQITYLANLAVSREEALQEKWAESKQMKRMGRQKYGF